MQHNLKVSSSPTKTAWFSECELIWIGSFFKLFITQKVWARVLLVKCEYSAGNNSRSADIVRPNFEYVPPISHYDRTRWPNISPAVIFFKLLSVKINYVRSNLKNDMSCEWRKIIYSTGVLNSLRIKSHWKSFFAKSTSVFDIFWREIFRCRSFLDYKREKNPLVS